MRIFILLLTLALLFPLNAANANNSTETNEGNKKEYKMQIQERNQNIQITKQVMKETLKEEKKEMLEKIKDLRISIKEKRVEMKLQLQEKQKDFNEKIQTIKDEKKQKAASRIDENLAKINTKRTDQMTNTLERLEELLDKISVKTSELKASGTDVTEVEDAIAKSETSIDNAKSLVAEQAGKEYIAENIDENTLGNMISEEVQSLRSDLKEVHQAVIEAHKSVRNAAQKYTKLNVNKIESTPEPTGNI